MSLLESVQERLHQHRDRSFLKAAMAASALAAYADGTVSLTERYSIDDMLENLERLKLHDHEKATQILNDYIHALQDDPESAQVVLIGKLKRIADDREAANLIVQIALAVSYADGHYNYAEKLQFVEICKILGLDPKEASLTEHF
jgi:tellurite resistance protein TerB